MSPTRRTSERADVVAARQALRQRRADALDPALLDAARRVRAALVSARYDATQGTDDFAHCVTVRHVTSDDLGAVDALTQRAAAPMWGDCRHAQSYITVRLTAGRAVELEARCADLARQNELLHGAPPSPPPPPPPPPLLLPSSPLHALHTREKTRASRLPSISFSSMRTQMQK